MKLDSGQVDLIVKRVVAQLVKDSSRNDLGASAQSNSSLTARNVISANDLTNGMTELRVSSKTLITPLAKDEIKKRAIRVVLVASVSQQNVQGDRPWLIVEPEIKLATGSPVVAEQTVKLVLEVLSQNRIAVVTTRRPFELACLLNRFSNVKAAFVSSENCIASAMDQLKPNVFVINFPCGKTENDMLLRLENLILGRSR